MNDTLNVGLTKTECDLLLRGLGFVRSAVLFDIRDPNPDGTNDRDEKLKTITALAEQLDGSHPATATAGV